MDSAEAALKPDARWDPAGYELNDFDFSELAEMFSELRTGCGQNFNAYFHLLKRFVKLSITNYELDLNARKFLSAELMPVHERFVDRILQICKLPVKTRSLEDILSGDDDKGYSDKIFLPHVSTLNALVIIYSLACGWNAPDREVGELLADAVHTMLRDRIDAALAVKNLPVTNEIGVHARYQVSSEDASQSASAALTLTAKDFLKSFSCKNHFLADESAKLLRLPSHSNFYKRLKSFVPEEQWDCKLEKVPLDSFVKSQKQDGSMDTQSSSAESRIDSTGNQGECKYGTVRLEKATKRPNYSGPQPAKRKHEDLPTNSVSAASTILTNVAVDADQNG